MIFPSSSHHPLPSHSCLPLLNFVKLSPQRTFSLCLPAAYQRPGSPVPPPACLCRCSWTHEGSFSACPQEFRGTHRYRITGPRQRREKRKALAMFILMKDNVAWVIARCSQQWFSTMPGGEQTKHSVRRWKVNVGNMTMFVALQHLDAEEASVCYLCLFKDICDVPTWEFVTKHSFYGNGAFKPSFELESDKSSGSDLGSL